MKILKLNLIAVFYLVLFFSCSTDSDEAITNKENSINASFSVNNDEVVNETVLNLEYSNRTQVENFTVVFSDRGIYTNNDEFMRSNPLLEKALFTLNSFKEGPKSTENTSFTITENGFVVSENEYYNERRFVEVLLNDGDLNYLDQDATIVYNKNGYKSISNEEIFINNPELREYFINVGEAFMGNIPEGKEVSMGFNENKFFVNGEELPLFGQDNYPQGIKYDYFRDCVGYYWWAPVINIALCAIAVVIEFYILP